MNSSCLLRLRVPTAACAVAALALLSVGLNRSDAASSPSSTRRGETSRSVAVEPAAPTDPYAAFLNEIATQSEACKKHAEALQGLLKQREDLLGSGASSGAKPDEELTPKVRALDEKIGAEELGLRECLVKQNPPEPPPPPTTVPRAKDGSVIPVEKLRSDYYPPVPPAPPTVVVPPPPTREESYVNFLTAVAGSSPLVAEMVEDLRELLAERREAALRYLSAEAATRPFIASQIYALSQRIQATAAGIQDAPPDNATAQTAGM